MIQSDGRTLPFLSITFTSSNWDSTQLQSALDEIFQHVELAISNNARLKVLVTGNATVSNPPMRTWPQIISAIATMQQKFAIAVDRAAVFTPNDSMNAFFDILFTVCEPTRPVELFSKLDDAREWLVK